MYFYGNGEKNNVFPVTSHGNNVWDFLYSFWPGFKFVFCNWLRTYPIVVNVRTYVRVCTFKLERDRDARNSDRKAFFYFHDVYSPLFCKKMFIRTTYLLVQLDG